MQGEVLHAWEERNMSLFDMVREVRSGRLVQRWSAEIAQRSAQSVLQRVLGQIHEMSQAEGAGYIRARAIFVVNHQVERALAQEPSLSESLRSRLLDASLTRVVLQTQQILAKQPMGSPAMRVAA
jgi:hypothetical protein